MHPLLEDPRLAPLKRFALPVFAGVWLVVLLACWMALPTTVSDVQLRNPTAKSVELPYTFQNGNGPYTFTAMVEVRRQPAFLSIRLDDCIEKMSVENRIFHTTPCKGNESWLMSRVELPRDLPVGVHEITITGKNNGGDGLLDIRQAHGMRALHVLLLWLLGVGWAFLAQRRGLGVTAWLMGASAFLMAFLYHLTTDAFMRSHDVGGHREYVEHLLAHWNLPTVKQGWETWQPPLYYVTGSVLTRVLDVFMVDDPFRLMQWLSAAVYVAVVLCALWQVPRMGFTKGMEWLAPALLLLLPGHVFVSGRINNDAVMAGWGMAITLLTWSYAQKQNPRMLALLGVALMLALMTKTTSLSLCLAAGLMVLWLDHRQSATLAVRVRHMLVVSTPSLVWFGLWLYRNHLQTGEWLYVNGTLTDSLRINNTAWKFLSFDLEAFLGDKEFNTLSGKVRESLPTALATSLLQGEFKWDGFSATLLTFQRAMFLPVLGMLVVGVLWPPAPGRRALWAPAMLVLLCNAFFMLAYNWSYPYACNMDARLWAPCFFPASLLAMHGQHVVQGWLPERWRLLATALPVMFLGVALGFLREVIFL